MRIAQRLYENGYITYMRTDSVNLSETAIAAARQQILEPVRRRLRAAAAPPVHRQGQERAGGARGDPPGRRLFRTPGEVANELSAEEFRLYELIWQRTIASQMTDAVGNSHRRCGSARRPPANESVDFGATGKTITDPGFLRAYVESSDDENAEAEDAERRLPVLVKGQALTAEGLTADRPHDPAAGPLHRGVAGQGDGGARHRPPVDLRLDHARRSTTAGTCSSAARP